MTGELCYLSATDALANFASGELSPVALMQAIIDRANAVKPKVNAFSHTFYDEAMEQARSAEQRYREGTARSLEGLPLAVKDSIHHKDKPFALGSLLLKDNVATSTEPWLQRLLDAGAIVHAKTTTPEFLFNGTTYSRLNGVTRNPWNLDFSAGASSGGSGAALAAGTTTLALGTDGGGSIRLPASQNGMIGFKPPYGRVPAVFPNSFDTYYMNGPMAQAADAEGTTCPPQGGGGLRVLGLMLGGLAYVLIEGMRRMALSATDLAKASPQTIRLTLLRVGAVVVSNTRRVRLLMSRSHPDQAPGRRIPRPAAALNSLSAVPGALKKAWGLGELRPQPAETGQN